MYKTLLVCYTQPRALRSIVRTFILSQTSNDNGCDARIPPCCRRGIPCFVVQGISRPTSEFLRLFRHLGGQPRHRRGDFPDKQGIVMRDGFDPDCTAHHWSAQAFGFAASATFCDNFPLHRQIHTTGCGHIGLRQRLTPPLKTRDPQALLPDPWSRAFRISGPVRRRR